MSSERELIIAMIDKEIQLLKNNSQWYQVRPALYAIEGIRDSILNGQHLPPVSINKESINNG